MEYIPKVFSKNKAFSVTSGYLTISRQCSVIGTDKQARAVRAEAPNTLGGGG